MHSISGGHHEQREDRARAQHAISNHVNHAVQRGAIVGAFVGALVDVARSGLSPVGAGVCDLHERRWVVGDGDLPSGFSDEGFVVRVEGRYHHLAVDDTPNLVDVVNFVQDWAIDELGTGWPELKDSMGAFLMVLSPAAERDSVVWRGKQGDVARVGELDLR